MKKALQKIMMCIVSISIMCSSAVASGYADLEDNNFDFDAVQAEDMCYLSNESLTEVYEELLSFAQSNRDESAMDNYLLSVIREYKDEIQTNKMSRDSVKLVPNDAEQALMAEYPSQAAAYLTVSRVANGEALRRYTDNSCWWSGNGDAFRHTYWSASLMKRYYDLFAWDVAKCGSTAKMWTDAHEEDGEPWDIHHDMDILNNYAGRDIGYSYYNKTEGEILNKAQQYVDDGFCKRVDIRNDDTEEKLYPTDTTEKRT